MNTNPTATLPETDRGPCLAVLAYRPKPPHVRCEGRLQAVEPLLWVCDSCGKRIEHQRPPDVMHFDLDRTPRSGADGKKGRG